MRHVVRITLAVALAAVGVTHFTATEEFLGQTPTFLPWRTAVVYVSGAIEVVLGVALLTARRWRPEVGAVTALFFVLVFPGNIYQAVEGVDAFGLDSDLERWARLALQPVLVVAAWWSTRPRRVM